MSPNNTPGFGQQSLDVGQDTLPRDLEARKSIGGAVSLEFWGIDIADLAGVEPADTARINPYRLTQVLTEGDYKDSPSRVDGLLWRADEYLLLPRSPRALGEAATKASLKIGGTRDHEKKLATSQRAAIHALEGKMDKLVIFQNSVDTDLERGKNFRNIIKARGWWRTNEGNLRQIMSYVWENNFRNMVNVVAEYEYWNNEELKSGYQALTLELLTGPQAGRIKSWHYWNNASMIYNLNKQQSIKRIIKNTNTEISKRNARA